MAITDKEQGVWNLDEVYNKINQGGIWTYTNVNQLWSWGYYREGGEGRNQPTISRSSPVQVAGKDFSFATQDSWFGMGIDGDGGLWGWGNNDQGALGQNDRTTRSSPIQIGSDTTWSKVSQGIYQYPFSYGIKTNGTLWGWGDNQRGHLGQNDRNDHRSSPTQIGSDATWDYVSSGYGPIVTKTDGTLWMWGANYGGALGQNNKTDYSSPVQIPGTTWSSGARKNARGGGSGSNVGAIKTDGTLWSWGYNTWGELGLNNRTQYSSPRQIPGTTWNKVSRSNECAVATKTDGTLWVWGRNYYGNFGIPSIATENAGARSSPVQVGSDTTWDDVFSLQSYTVATKTDGTLWAWGRNNKGYLGQNNLTDYSSPVQIPGTSWITENINYCTNRDGVGIFNNL
jgi:alpha-tubulin suppressor-like RCC1 family protein